MTLDGGLGAVTQKNVNLLNTCSEKISAVLKDCESQEIWLITLSNSVGQQGNWDTFFAYSISETGIDPTPVTSPIPVFTFADSRGYLKLSPDGTKLACANVGDGLFLFDFDTQTGIVSNLIQLIINNQTNKPYGIEFSPNNNLLYVTASNDYFAQDGSAENPANHQSVLIQYDLTVPDIVASQVLLDNRRLYRGGLQLGPDGKIYRALSSTYLQGLPFLGVINEPNLQGTACDYVHNAVSLGSNNSSQGLPPFIQSFFNEKIDIIRNGENTSNYLPLCDGDTYTLQADDIPGANYIWTFDGNLLPESDFDLVINQPGLYELLIELNTGDCDVLEGEALVEYFPLPIASNASLIQCDEDGVADGITSFNLFEAFDDLTANEIDRTLRFFQTLNAATNSIDEVDGTNYINQSNPEIIYVQVINNQTGCFDIAELTLEVSVTQIGDYIADALCDELDSEDGINTFESFQEIENGILAQVTASVELSFYETYNDALLEQNEIVTPYTNTNPYNQIIYVRAENDNACYGISEVTLTINPLPQFLDDEITYYCLNTYPDKIVLDAGVTDINTTGYSYLWSTGEITESIEINELGTYTVTVTNNFGCSKERTIVVEPSNIATIENITVVDGSAIYNNSITIQTSGEGTYQYALSNPEQNIYITYQNENVFTNVFPGIYTVLVKDIKNDCGVVEELISVIGFPQYFTPNNDGYNDKWQVYGISNQFQPNSLIYIYDRFGKLLKQLEPKSEGWDGTFNGNPLPNNDYWFEVTLQDGRKFTNHFTLKR
jgi:gliding motility-associated-like protein